MSNILNLISEETYAEKMDKQNALLAVLASNVGEGLSVKSFSEVQGLVRQGYASKIFAVSDQLETERKTSVSVSIGDSAGITAVTVDETKLIGALQSNMNGTFVLTHNGNVWLNQVGESVTLSNWGLAVVGTPAENDVIIVTITAATLTFDILDFDKHTPANRNLSHSIALGLHNVFTHGTIPFCAAQLMYYTEGGLPAGSYRFTLDHAAYGGGTTYDGTYMFTITQEIPADGGFRHTNIGGWKESYAQSDVIGNHITTYGTRPQRTAIEKGVAVSVWDGSTACTDLGTFTARSLTYHTETDDANSGKRNFTERNAYGSNRWRDSVYRQWLNSDAEAVPSADTATVSNWWKPATVFDRPPNGANLAGFLNGLAPEFVAVLGEIEVKTALCDGDKVDGATYDITYDKVWLQSLTEIFGSNNSGIAEGTQLTYWKGATNEDRIKYQNNTARHWFLRSPVPTYASYVRDVTPSGALDSIIASHAVGVVPACCII